MPSDVFAIAALLPHAPPMLLLDAIREHDDEHIVALLRIAETSQFLEAEGVPAYVGIEYMAQACGAFAGVEARLAERPVRVGFLLGARQYRALVPWFRRGDELTVTARLDLRDEAMAAFDCRIEIAGSLAATARLNVYQPETPP